MSESLFAFSNFHGSDFEELFVEWTSIALPKNEDARHEELRVLQLANGQDQVPHQLNHHNRQHHSLRLLGSSQVRWCSTNKQALCSKLLLPKDDILSKVYNAYVC